jgi:excisionase family DNA binding protein
MLNDPILLSVKDTAVMLGNVSTRHVYRLIHDEGLPVVRIGKRKMAVPTDKLKEWIALRMNPCHTVVATGPVAKKEKPWDSIKENMGRIKHQSGGSLTSMRAAKEL